MAIDVPIARSETVRIPLGQARLAAVPARLVLVAIVACSAVFRALAALVHTTPLYFPDEYIYSSIARSIVEEGRPLVRGGPANFPALLEPLLAAPFWIPGDPELAYRLTQIENAVFFSLGAVPVYLLVRRLGFGAGAALAAAALTVASPDLLFASFVLSEPLAYPLVLGAVYAGVCCLGRPTRANQLAVVALCGLAVFTRIQYVFLPVVFVVGALVVERFRIRRVARAYPLALGLFAAPLAGVVALGPARVFGYYSVIADRAIRPGPILHWLATDALLLAYAAGLVLVPGALVGIAYALARPRSREERAFAALATGLAACIFAQAALFATNGSPRFQERYFMTLLPLVFPAFCLYLRRGRPARLVVCLLAVVLLALSARIPLSGYTMGVDKQDSPFLFAVFWVERTLGVENGSLAVALAAAALCGLAVGVALRARLARAAVVATLVFSAGASLAAIEFDRLVTDSVRTSFVAKDPRWIDNAGVRDAVLIQTPAAPRARAHEQLYWNTSLTDLGVISPAPGIDVFRDFRLTIAGDGRLLARGRTLRRPLAISNYAVTTQLSGATRVARGPAFELWRPAGTPRMSLYMGGRYHDSWLAPAGHVTLWPDASGRVRGVLRVQLSLPVRAEPTRLRFKGPGVDRTVTVVPGERLLVELPVSARKAWTLRFRTGRPGYLANGRPVSVRAEPPVFERAS